jgi:ceramide glucosyltransferase
MVDPRPLVWMAAAVCLAIRLVTAWDNQRRLTRSVAHSIWFWLVPIKDLLQGAVWILAFLGNTVEWRGERFRVLRTGELVRMSQGRAGT